MHIITGLGNPGRKYENTRHNLGFITVDRLAEEHGISVTKSKHKALIGEGRISGQKVLLVKPQTFMNLSGEAVRAVMDYYKEPVENLLVIYDDADIPAGAVRIRKKGGAGTHNGMKSVVSCLGDDGFARIRIGIGTQDDRDIVDHVLGGFTREEADVMREAVLTAVSAVECMLSEGIDIAMNEYNTRKETVSEED
ncbi:MAG: aminoacyl-tRNA hydrolase [Oscillospiraceae bacterium]|nr:aminoacyl-tRNA hydrolase [Bacillota bacterium]MBR2741075.1 aminoacyl-tRNA hydrolase [Oscillospiraceae bacterium]